MLSKSDPTSPAPARPAGLKPAPSGMTMPFNMARHAPGAPHLPAASSSFRYRTACNNGVAACEWPDRMAPPRPSIRSARARAPQVFTEATVVGTQVAQVEVGSDLGVGH